jgi:acetyl-CoA carboxylase biotin carboxyl carrier protein
MTTSPEKNGEPKPEKKKNGEPKPEKKNEGVVTSKIKVRPELAVVQDMIRLMNEADINEINFEQGKIKIHLRKGPGAPFQSIGGSGTAPSVVITAGGPAPAPPSAAAPAPSDAPQAKAGSAITLNSPMVGTFYRSQAPESKAFIEEGDKITVGQVYCIVEAMKLMNEVKSEVAGKVVKILVQNGQAIEFNQPLIIVDPS